MDIFNRPPSISEDTLQYAIYQPPALSDKASVSTFAACIQSHVDILLVDFIWHRDPFEIKIVQNPDLTAEGWVLEGRMRVGDCVDDEWFTVWLLREISAKWDVVISVYDTDGEFLLIEAAEALPPWVQPTNTENRVWIYNSHLHLVPLSHISPPSRKRHRRVLPGTENDEDALGGPDDETDDFISAGDAVELVRNPSNDTLAPEGVEKLVWERISGYPAAMRDHHHITQAYIPADVAKALFKYPLLIQKAVETFYTRDAIQLRAAHRMSRFPPDSSVLRGVKMTRTAYAQLVGQKFFPPKAFGHWTYQEGSDEWRWHDTGMKIAVGFEILYQESKGRMNTFNTDVDAVQSSTEANKDALRRTPEYMKYIENLISTDYFRGEVRDSALWNVLESRAAEIYIDVRKEDNFKRQSFAAQVNIATSELSALPASPWQGEGPEDWLNVDAQDLEAILERAAGTKAKAPLENMDVDDPHSLETQEEHLASEQASKLKEFAAKVETFVEGEGDLEGAKFDDEEFSDEAFSDDESESEGDDEAEKTVSERQTAMDKLVPGLDPSEYGKMPASYHTNSQRVAPTTIETEIVGGEDESEAPTSKVIHTQSPPKPVRKPIIPRDRYDGVDSDDETDEETADDDDTDEDRPQVVGDIEIDMGEEEEEFLEFSRQALGISDAQWNEILQDRRQRGVFVPTSANHDVKPSPNKSADRDVDSKQKHKERKQAPGPRPNVNPNLDSFEAVMKAMDDELSRTKSKSKKSGSAQPPPNVDKGKRKTTVEDEDESSDIEMDMDAELRAALEKEDDTDDDENEEPMDYNLIKNFLESFKSQAGLSGPVGNLAGRLQPEWKLPRDAS